MSIAIGTAGWAETAVTPENTAQAVGSGTLAVFATPAMAALMERAAYTSIQPELEEGQGSVGIDLQVRHLAATPVGMRVRAESRVTEVKGRTVTFQVRAYDETGLIGEGIHKRSIISNDCFLEKCYAKRPEAAE